ncbi:MAG: addiction module protein [Sulfurovum sp.]|nr:addiction module protein [Sulfurovum sp.]
MSLNDIIDEALSLKPQERYVIIENLINSLDMPDSKIEEAWIVESEKRVEALKKGKLEMISEEVFFSS